MSFPLIEHGGSGPTLHFAPATGFPLTTYQPILAALSARYRCVTIPPRALWPDPGPPPSTPGSWADLGHDLVVGLEQHQLTDVIAIGHSFGGVASLVAAARYRSLFRGLALLDPTILTTATMDAFRAAKATGWRDGHPLAARARERRSEFADHDEAFGYWREKKLFGDWSDEALSRYVDGMLRPAPGGGYTLTWTGDWEAYYYESFYPDTFDDARRLDPSLPILVVGGGTSDTFEAPTAARFKAVVPWAEVTTVPGHGHLFPQSAPESTARVLLDWLARNAAL